MADFIIKDGDTVNFLPAFVQALVVVVPAQIRGSGHPTINGAKVCIEGDESGVSSPGCAYMAPPYVISGSGTLKIDQLAGDQLARKTLSQGKAVILKGKQFDAVFEVMVPAMMPSPVGPQPDPTSAYKGLGMFITTNVKIKGE